MDTVKVLIPLAEGFEEIEAVTIIDILRRAGAEAVSAGLTGRYVTGSHGIRIEADVLLDDVLNKEWTMIVFPGGGKGVENLLADDRIVKIVHNHCNKGKDIAAVCAAPRILDQTGVTRGKPITIHPSQKQYINRSPLLEQAVVDEGTVITGRSAGAAMEFALTLVRRLFGEDKWKEVERGLISGVKLGS